MKIIGGKYRNRNFFMPEGIRPTQNIVRKAIFDLIGHDLEGVELLDLFAGSGADPRRLPRQQTYRQDPRRLRL